jgi:hypothetical protein
MKLTKERLAYIKTHFKREGIAWNDDTECLIAHAEATIDGPAFDPLKEASADVAANRHVTIFAENEPSRTEIALKLLLLDVKNYVLLENGTALAAEWAVRQADALLAELAKDKAAQ